MDLMTHKVTEHLYWEQNLSSTVYFYYDFTWEIVLWNLVWGGQSPGTGRVVVSSAEV